jgi:hypothetical protein
LERNVRNTANKTQKKIEKASERYMAEEITGSHFLKVCGSVYPDVCDVQDCDHVMSMDEGLWQRLHSRI